MIRLAIATNARQAGTQPGLAQAYAVPVQQALNQTRSTQAVMIALLALLASSLALAAHSVPQASSRRLRCFSNAACVYQARYQQTGPRRAPTAWRGRTSPMHRLHRARRVAKAPTRMWLGGASAHSVRRASTSHWPAWMRARRALPRHFRTARAPAPARSALLDTTRQIKG
jgi:hypothetical protein